MKKTKEPYYVDEKDLDQKITTGKLLPVTIPAFVSFSEIEKYQFCSEIIKFKKNNDLTQKDISLMLEINKSEVSKLFSYQLKEFSQERLLGFLQTLIQKGAKISMDNVWDQIKNHSRKLERKIRLAEKSA
jgi:predicted XRE-type DNA-binding protein